MCPRLAGALILPRMASRGSQTSTSGSRFEATVDFVADNCVIFDISGNEHRLVVRVAHSHKRVLIKFAGTDAEYDKIDARTV